MTNGVTWRKGLGLTLAAAGVLLAACTEETPCDENQVLRDGFCWAADAAVPPADAATSGEAGSAAFGQTCADITQCAPPAVFCAVQPGQSSGFCTALGCEQDPGICPAGWTCMDLTSFGMAAHMCIPGA